MSVAISLHLLSAIIWVGGMFFAHVVLRPSAIELEPTDRMPLWGRVLKRFFSWVWFAILLLLLSGYWMVFSVYGGFSTLPVYLHLMHGIGWVMILLFLHLWFAPSRRFKQQIGEGNYENAARYLNQIRLIVTINLTLGLINSVIGVSGIYW